MTYRNLPHDKAHELIDWAELNNVEWDVWNAEECLMGITKHTELGLSKWPK